MTLHPLSLPLIGAISLILLGPRAVELGPGHAATGWEEFRLGSRRPSCYVLAPGEAPVLLARAERSASLFFTRVHADPAALPILTWRWRVDRVPPRGDLRDVATDDAAARVYVGFRYDPSLVPLDQRLAYRLFRLRHGEFPPFAALAYVWAAAPAAGTGLRHPDYERLHEIVLRSGTAGLGEWHEERRDLLADYRAAFGADPPPLSHVAVMTDADDTSSEAAAAFAGITLSPR